MKLKLNFFLIIQQAIDLKIFYAFDLDWFETYKGVQVNFIKNDKKYIIHVIAGQIDFPNNIKSMFEGTKKMFKRTRYDFFQKKEN